MSFQSAASRTVVHEWTRECREVIRQLSAKGVQVVALVRDINRAASKLPTANVQLVQGDLYQYATIPAALKGCDAVICAASTRDNFDPFGPFKVDFSVRRRASPILTAASCLIGSVVLCFCPHGQCCCPQSRRIAT